MTRIANLRHAMNEEETRSIDIRKAITDNRRPAAATRPDETMDNFEMRIRTAAIHYAHGERDANRLAARVGISARTLYRVAKPGHHLNGVWRETLSSLGYEGEGMSFRVKPGGRKKNTEGRAFVLRAWQAMSPAERASTPRQRLARQLALDIGANVRTVASWLREFESGEEQ